MLSPGSEFMQMAIEEAKKAKGAGDYAVGAVLVRNGKVIAKCSNRSKRDESPIAHAETLAIIEGSKALKNRHLNDCVLYTTHEPCPMCASVIVWARLKGVVFGARIEDMSMYRKTDADKDYLWRTIDISCKEILTKSTEEIALIENFMRDECRELFHNGKDKPKI